MNKIKKAVIPVGGYGTRFFPSSKSTPKELFPLGKKPIVMHVVEEVIASGIKDIIFIMSPYKQSIESFFSHNQFLEDYLNSIGKTEDAKESARIAEMAEFTYVHTKPPYGNGGCLHAVRHLLEGEPFALIWGDEIILGKEKPRLAQCIEAYEKTGKPIISSVEIKNPRKRSSYGMAELRDVEGSDVKEIVRIVEKPAFGTEPSSFATHGAYILPPEVYKALDQTQSGKDGELWLVDVLNNLKKETGLYAKIIENGMYLDCGNPKDYMLSQIIYNLSCSQNPEDITEFIRDIKDIEENNAKICN